VGWERVAVRCLFLFLCAEGEPASFHAAPAPPQASLCSTRPKRLLISQAKAAAPASSYAKIVHPVPCWSIYISCMMTALSSYDQFMPSIQSINIPSIHQRIPSNPIKTLQWSLNNQTAEPSPPFPPRCLVSAARAVSPAIRKGCD
jgi:hypothetical protein